MSKTERVFGALVRLMFAARQLTWQAVNARPEGLAPSCPWCSTKGKRNEPWLPGRHSAACLLGAMARILWELESNMSIQAIADMAAIEVGAEGSAPANAGTPPAATSAGGALPGHVAPTLARKPPGRAGGSQGSPDARPPLVAGLVDFGEPWHIAPDDPSAVVDRAGEVMHDGFGSTLDESQDPQYARRLAAAVNLCAGAPTEQLERAFEEIASRTARWALMAIDVENLGAGHLGAIRDFIDGTIAEAARPQPAAAGRPQ